jgi:hypothetical protein
MTDPVKYTFQFSGETTVWQYTGVSWHADWLTKDRHVPDPRRTLKASELEAICAVVKQYEADHAPQYPRVTGPSGATYEIRHGHVWALSWPTTSNAGELRPCFAVNAEDVLAVASLLQPEKALPFTVRVLKLSADGTVPGSLVEKAAVGMYEAQGGDEFYTQASSLTNEQRAIRKAGFMVRYTDLARAALSAILEIPEETT